MKIKVNGREWNYPDDRPIGYNDVFVLAYLDDKGEPRNGASITYHWNGERDIERNGMIHGDETVKPADGMVFDCYFA